ncbi:unnamed protein product [Lactuca virosa]|uniref:Uncharacterized protein n=1 Tax=Lactuca virosa TaxID=75947 RepID=A0AAU9N0J2_9ASTR|nr:unnamed protein product [Lactuca virosa]
MAKSLFFFFMFHLTLFISISSSTPNPDNSSSSLSSTPLTAHSVLTHHGFPIGLLPTDVLSYDLNHTSGEFSVNLGYPCRLILPPDNYLATYSKKVTGKLGWLLLSILPRTLMKFLNAWEKNTRLLERHSDNCCIDGLIYCMKNSLLLCKRKYEGVISSYLF